MEIKYISKNKAGLWGVSTSKTGKPVKNFAKQEEAIIFAANQKNTGAINVKRSSGWHNLDLWHTYKAKEQEVETEQENEVGTTETVETTKTAKKKFFNWKKNL